VNASTASRPTIAGAEFVRTASFDETLIKASEMTQRYGTLLVTGPTGVGKTETCRQAMAELSGRYQLPGLWVQLGRNPNPKEVVCQLLRALGITPKRSEPTWVLALELGDLLAQEPRTVWIDEAQYLRTDAFTTVRTIHDRTDAIWMLGLVGSHELLKRLKSDQPELLSRAGRRVEMRRIEDDRTLLAILASWHPLLADCPPSRLIRMNRVGPKGNFRAWEHLLETLVRLADTVGGLTEHVEAVALHQCSYTLPAELAKWLPTR